MGLMYEAGLRTDEVLSLKPRDVVLEEKRIEVLRPWQGAQVQDRILPIGRAGAAPRALEAGPAQRRIAVPHGEELRG